MHLKAKTLTLAFLIVFSTGLTAAASIESFEIDSGTIYTDNEVSFSAELVNVSSENVSVKLKIDGENASSGTDFQFDGQSSFQDGSNSFKTTFSEEGSHKVTLEMYDRNASENPVDQETLNLNVQPEWQIVKQGNSDTGLFLNGDEIEDGVVKERHLENLELRFEILRDGQTYSSVSDSEFLLSDSEDQVDRDTSYFEKTSSGTYSLKFDTMPGLQLAASEDSEEDLPTSIDLQLDVEHQPSEGKDLDMEVLKFEVKKDVNFEGQVRNVLGNSVSNARFQFCFGSECDSGGGVTDSHDVNSEGYFNYYSSRRMADTVEMSFRRATIELRDMVLSLPDSRPEADKNILYNYYSQRNRKITEQTNLELENEIDDVRPVNLLAVTSRYPFAEDNNEITMNYDTGNINALNVQVYECRQWSFNSESCFSGWDRVTDNFQLPGPGTANFDINPLSSEKFGDNKNYLRAAYLVGVERGTDSKITLANSLNVSSSRLKAGSDFTVSGKLIGTRTGEPVSDADVTVSLLNEEDEVEESFSASSGSNGVFEISETISEEFPKGEYQLRISAEKGEFENLQQTSGLKMEVYYETGLSMSSPGTVNIRLGELSDIDYEIENTGQKDVEDIEFSVSAPNVDEDSFWVEPDSIGTLEPGESVTAELMLNLSEDFCPYPCTNPPEFTLTAEGVSAGEDVEAEANVYSNINQEPPSNNNNNNDEEEEEETQQQQEPTSPDNNEGSSLSAPDVNQITGQFIESQSEVNVALGLILAFTVVLAAAIKKKKTGDDDDRQRPVQSSRVSKPNVSAQPDEQEEKGSNTDSGEESEEEGSESSEEESSEEAEFVCDTCGEEFDTQSGLNLHEKAMH